MDKVTEFKALVSAVLAILTALWGWFGWLVICWVVCMALDYLTGTAAALRLGEWDSSVARDGLWHKLGSVVAVLVAGMLDLVVGHLLGRLPNGVTLPVEYTVFLSPLVVVWYILTEAGSILENAGKLGAEYPPWLTNAVKVLRAGAEQVGKSGTPRGKE